MNNAIYDSYISRMLYKISPFFSLFLLFVILTVSPPAAQGSDPDQGPFLATTPQSATSGDLWSLLMPDGTALPRPESFRSDIATPAEVLGFEPGEWHVRHDQIVAYMYRLARESDRVQIQEYGRTWQRRPLLLLTISHPDNLASIDSLRTDHLALSDPSRSMDLDLSQMPVVTWLGYSVHGNESSGANAAILVAYYLAAAEGEEVEHLLRESVVLLDPTYNPDGLDRFATWVNNNRSFTPSGDPYHREHRQPWPGSRTNHYWFDLNRDWMPVQHPESRNRVRTFHSWKPNVLTDHHEMGPQATYFFQPGVPSRDNPLTPQRTFELTAKLAEYHAGYLDEVDQLYWTSEFFDDFFIGKGSTYPDLQGTVGILFEQASSRGHLQESRHGDVAFPVTIRNQFLTSLSTLYGAMDLRLELLEHMREAASSALEDARGNPVKAWVFGDPYDRARNAHLLDLLSHHDIRIHELEGSLSADGYRFESGNAWIIPAVQPQYRLIRSLFETRKEFEDSVFYDISTWTLPLAFDIPYAELDRRSYRENLLGPPVADTPFPEGRFRSGPDAQASTDTPSASTPSASTPSASMPSASANAPPANTPSTNSPPANQARPYAYLFEWHGYYAPRAAYRLMDAGVRIKVATQPFRAVTAEGPHDFDYGTILVSAGIQDRVDADALRELMMEVAKEDGLDVHMATTGLTARGMDLGSPSFQMVEKPSVMVVTGDGVNMYEAGEVWHLLDQRYRMPVTMADVRYLNSVDLDRYNTVVMVHGNYQRIPGAFRDRLKQWVEAGNTLMLQKGALSWMDGLDWLDFEMQRPEYSHPANEELRYRDLASLRGSRAIGGVIMEAELDRTHPLGYGFKRDKLPVFRNSTLFLKHPENRFAVPVRYTAEPLLSGFVSTENREYLPVRPVYLIGRMGSGRVIMTTDNPNFRAFWFGTNRLFANGLFFGRIIHQDATIR
ncbi:MAG: zinc carboxypeptidase [Balneolaceae bacterium]|nr:MAG: zinc carboxypeptidase [Balneolaceae bacterium]